MNKTQHSSCHFLFNYPHSLINHHFHTLELSHSSKPPHSIVVPEKNKVSRSIISKILDLEMEIQLKPMVKLSQPKTKKELTSISP